MENLTDEERQEFLHLAGATESGLAQIIQKSYDALGLISFFTKNENEVRAWDALERVKVRSRRLGSSTQILNVVLSGPRSYPYEKYIQYGNDLAIKSAGEMRLEGQAYIVQDGDIIYFRFNV